MINPYLRLMRLHQPAGIFLLLWPCVWGLALAFGGVPSIKLLCLFALGSVVMRAAGCIVNDLADREFDKKVERTHTRPLASGEISVRAAVILLVTLLLTGFMIALQLPFKALLLAFASLPLVAIYPFMKRITWWPQLFLGLTFNWGALMGWVAVRGMLEAPALALYAAGIFWTLGYDTIYAHQDKEDDARIGVKSTALKLGARSRFWIAGFYDACWMLLALAGWLAGVEMKYYLMLIAVMAHFLWQVLKVDFNNPASCMRIFKSNIFVGALIALAAMV